MSLWDEGLAQFLADLRSRGVDKGTIDQFLKDKASSDDARRSCQSLQSDTNKKYGQVEVAGRQIPTKWIACIMDNINRFVSITDYAMKGAPETVGLAWFAVKQVLNAVQNNYKLYGFFGGALSDITEMMVTIRTYDKLYDERANASWRASDIVGELFKQIRNVYGAILDFSFSVKQHLSAGKMAKLGHAIKDALGSSSGEFEGRMGAIRTLKSKILESGQAAFQQKTFVKFDEVQETLKSVVEQHEASLKGQQEIQDSLENLVKQTKPKSREDYAKQEFDKIKKILNPLPDSGATFDGHLMRHYSGTCEWIYDHSEYTAWRNSSKSGILCIEGEHDIGKSILLASIISRLKTEFAADPDWTVQYLSCETLQNSTGSGARNDSSLSLSRVQNTLVYGMYELANLNPDGDTTLLEKCNMVFHNPKAKKATTAFMQHQKSEDLLPEMDDALEDLAQVLKKKSFLIIDAADMIAEHEQEAFAKFLRGLLVRPGLHIRILVSTYLGCKFYDSLESTSTPHITLSENNKGDMDLAVKGKLNNFPGWSDAERKEAHEAILQKAQSSFKYAVQIAIPFLEQPWQRPLSNRLKQLPGDLDETYNQALSQMAPNYRDLLQTSLTWALLANGPVTVTEVMDAYIGTYLTEGSLSEDSESQEESPLHREQIRAAGGPFLDCHKKDKQSIIKLKDPAAVRKFFIKEVDDIVEHTHDAHICDNCKNRIGTGQNFAISEKHGHLALATTLLKHLNSPSFQKRYLEITEEGDEKRDSLTADTMAEEGHDDTAAVNGNESGVNGEVSPLTEAKLEEHNASNEIASPDTIKEKNGDEAEENGNEENEDDDESQDSVDRSIGWDQGYQQIESADPGMDIPQDRYEIRHWFTHVRKAEALWPSKEERDGSEQWAILLSEMEEFVTNEPVFNAWMQKYRSYETVWKPIHIAAETGLISLTEHLLAKGADIMSLSSEGFTPLHLAVFPENKSEMLLLLLKRGAQPNFEADTSSMPAFHYWVLLGASGEDIQVLLDHGASSTMKSLSSFNVMHFLAWSGFHPEDLFLLLDHTDENGDCADINVVDDLGETPLHKLLSRRDTPLNLLQAFIDRGADVNIDDKDSQRPLSQAGWEGELEAMKIIIDKVTNIDDDDVNGRTVMHDAAWQGHLDVVKFLVEKGASPVQTDKHNRTPFLFACLGSSEETARYLLDQMIELGSTIEQINMATKRNRTPLRQASSKGFLEIVKILLDRIESPDVVNAVDTRKGRSALHCAAFRGRDKVVAALLNHGADTTLKDGVEGDGKTALQLCHGEWAIQGNQHFEETVSLLIDHDPAAAAQDALLLTTAAVNGSKRILEQLHKAEADLDKIDQYGWTPLLLARQFQNTDAVEFLSRQTMPTKWDCKVDTVLVTENGAGLQYPRRKLGVPIWEDSEAEERLCVVANRPISSGLSTYYYEVKILESARDVPHPEVAVGFSTVSDPTLLDFPGWPKLSAPSSKSWGYHGDNGGLYSYASWDAAGMGEPYGPGTVIGCGVDFASGGIWYTRDGKKIDQGFDKVMGRLFPVIGLHDKVALEANFGIDLENKPFMWKDEAEET